MLDIDIEESDRGCVIIAAANIEEVLDQILRAIAEGSPLPKKKTKPMFDTTGPFGNFSAKYLILATFGYLSRDTFDDLEKLRKLRNMFAHTSRKVKFEDQDVHQILKNMRCFNNANKLMNEKLGLPLDIMPSGDLVMAESEAQHKGLVKKLKSDFVISIGLLANDILDDMDKRLTKEKS